MKNINAHKTRYQKATAKKIVEAFKTAVRGRVCWPCGAGKSRLGFLVSQQYNCTLIMVPALSLVGQWIEKEKFAGSVLCVCSQEDLEESTTKLSIEVTTEPSVIKEFMKRPNPKVVFATYQSSKALSLGCKGQKFELAIFDEAHRTAGMADVFGMALHDKNVRIGHRLFLTATERRYRGKKDDIISMCNEKLYGASLDFVSFKQAIEWGWLADYVIAVPQVTHSQLLDVAGDEDAVVKAGGLLVKEVMRKKRLKKGFVFWSTRKRSLQFTATANRMGIKTFHIDGTMDQDQRDAIMEEFSKCKKAILSNVRVLVEGVDCPECDFVMFGDPKNSTTDIVQAAGRCIRIDENNPKKKACIIIPVIVSDDEKVQANEQYQTILSVIEAMGATDERLLDFVSAVARGTYKPRPDEPPMIECTGGFLASTSEDLKVKYIRRMRALAGWMEFAVLQEEVRSDSRIASESTYARFRQPQWPSNPAAIYPDWPGWCAFLGKPELRVRISLDDLRAEVLSDPRITGRITYWKFKRPHWPYDVARAYEDWPGWTVFLGKQDWLSLELLQEEVRLDKRITNELTYLEFRLPHWPSNPRRTYSDWPGWPEFLGRPRLGRYDAAAGKPQGTQVAMVSIKEAAKILGVHENTIRNLIRTGLKATSGERVRLRCFKTVGQPAFTTLDAIQELQVKLNGEQWVQAV